MQKQNVDCEPPKIHNRSFFYQDNCIINRESGAITNEYKNLRTYAGQTVKLTLATTRDFQMYSSKQPSIENGTASDRFDFVDKVILHWYQPYLVRRSSEMCPLCVTSGIIESSFCLGNNCINDRFPYVNIL